MFFLCLLTKKTNNAVTVKGTEEYVQKVALDPGLAARERYHYKLNKQYPNRQAGSVLYPLIVGDGGRWHETAEKIFRGFAKDAVKNEELSDDPVGIILRRRITRLSAILLRGVAAVYKEGLPSEAREKLEGPPKLLLRGNVTPCCNLIHNDTPPEYEIHRLWWPL